jgi:hypothetical protein
MKPVLGSSQGGETGSSVKFSQQFSHLFDEENRRKMICGGKKRRK